MGVLSRVAARRPDPLGSTFELLEDRVFPEIWRVATRISSSLSVRSSREVRTHTPRLANLALLGLFRWD